MEDDSWEARMAARAKARRQKRFHEEHCLRPQLVVTLDDLAAGIGVSRTKEQVESRHPDICRKCFEPRDDNPHGVAPRWVLVMVCRFMTCPCEHHKTEVWMAAA